jgi:predicted RecB family nuclease
MAYSQCPRKAFLILRGDQGGISHDYVDLLESRASKRLHTFLDTLRFDGLNLQASGERGIADNADVTAHAKLRCGDWEADVDALVRSEKSTGKAKHSYDPYVTVGTNEIPKEQKIRLAFIAAILSKLGSFRVETGNVINVSGKISRIRLTTIFPAIEKITSTLTSWRKHPPEPPPIVFNDHCSVCQFRKTCLEQAEKDDSLSLLDRMTPKIMQRYRKKGIFTTTQLSYLFKPRRPRKRRRPAPQKFNLELQALALRTRKTYVEESPSVPLHHVEIFLDIEGIPDCRTHYLIGMMVLVDDNHMRYSFWADTEQEEKKIFDDCLRIIEKYPEAPVYHYGSYEQKCLDYVAKKYDQNYDSIKRRLVNVNPLVFGKIYFPTRSNSLKDIGNFLGETWSHPEASGLMSIVWRLRWEETRDAILKQQLLAYNMEDCQALQRLVSEIRNIGRDSFTRADIDFASNPKQNTTPTGQVIHDSLKAILHIAHADYRRNRIEIRQGEIHGKIKRPSGGQKGHPGYDRDRAPKPNKIVRLRRAIKCKNHIGKPALVPTNKEAEHTIIDLAFTKNGCRKMVTKYAGIISYCQLCKKNYRPPTLTLFKRSLLFGDGFRVWVAYQRIILRLSYRIIGAVAREMFHESLSDASIINFTTELSKDYISTEKKSLQMILSSPFVHVDETKINIRGENQYVWVLTDGEHVVLKHTETRESDFILDILKNYKGVMISDFYAGYDSSPCRQQKCLVHLIRDLNDDLWKNPYDLEFERFVGSFKALLSPIIADVDKHGLKRHFLHKHEKAVEKFYKETIERECVSDIAKGYQKRFLRYQESLFRFLEEDGIPWNNNAAERAIRHLAVQRKISGTFFKDTFVHYLRLLGIAQTCRFQEKSFLHFLLSKQKNVDQFKEPKHRKASRPALNAM